MIIKFGLCKNYGLSGKNVFVIHKNIGFSAIEKSLKKRFPSVKQYDHKKYALEFIDKADEAYFMLFLKDGLEICL